MMSEGRGRAALRWVLAAAVTLAAVPALAVSVYLNGVNIDGVTSQKFENCTVELDSKGNVLIKAKGYQVQVQQLPSQPPPPVQQPVATPPPVQPQPPPPPMGATLTRRYFMVTEMNFPGMVQYEVDIFINSVWVKKIWDEEDQRIYFEVTRYMRPGRNVVHFTATKRGDQARRSNAPGHFLKLVMGEGNIGGDTVMIDNPLLEYRRNAGETQTFNDDFVVNAR
jgi:hypothetical protein